MSLFNIKIFNVRLYKIDKIVLFFYAMYYVMNPFYFWRSGLPQIADYLLIISMIIFLFHSKFSFGIKLEQKSLILSGLLFVIWIVVVNLLWLIILKDSSSLILNSLFYLYNFIVFSYTIVLAKKYKNIILATIFVSVIFSLGVQIIYYFFGTFDGERYIGNFNNPNQLGYYGLIMLSLLIFSFDNINVKFLWFFLGSIISIILILASLSMAAILSGFGLVFIHVFTNQLYRNHKKLSWIIFLFLLSTFLIFNNADLLKENQLLNSVSQKIENIGLSSDDSLEGRGYYRILDYPQYWLFGAGEGEYSRFIIPLELHSTLGNIQVSYGLIGSILFLFIIFKSLKINRYESWYIILALLTYGLTHNGIRNSLFWIIIALIASFHGNKYIFHRGKVIDI